MISVKGYYDGDKYVTTETVYPHKNQSVIITLLDEEKLEHKPVTLEQLDTFVNPSKNSDNAQDYISSLRSDRVF